MSVDTTTDRPNPALSAARAMRGSARQARERAQRMIIDDAARRERLRALWRRSGHGGQDGSAGAAWPGGVPQPAPGERLTTAVEPARTDLATGSGATRSSASDAPAAPPAPTLHWLYGDDRAQPAGPDLSRVACALHTEVRGSSLVLVRVVGELDRSTVPTLSEEVARLLAAARPPTELVIDLDEVTFADAGAVGALLGAARTARSRGIGFRVGDCSPTVSWLLDLTGAHEELGTTRAVR